MPAHQPTADAVKRHAALNGATVAEGNGTITINLDTVDLSAKDLEDLERLAKSEGHQVRVAKGTAGTGTNASLVIEPRP
jgi:hypothetical protein